MPLNFNLRSASPRSRIQQLLGLLITVAGMFIMAGSIILWLKLGHPLEQTVVQTQRTVSGLHIVVAALTIETKRLPDVAHAAAKSFGDSQKAVQQVNESQDKILAQALSMIPMLETNARLPSQLGDVCAGFAKATTWVPAKGFHEFRTTLYQWDTQFKVASTQSLEAVKVVREQLEQIRPAARTALNSTAQSLTLMSEQVSNTEKSVLPALPPVLEALASELDALLAVLAFASNAVFWGVLIFVSVGFAFACSGLAKIHAAR